jgi:hypothetical protein
MLTRSGLQKERLARVQPEQLERYLEAEHWVKAVVVVGRCSIYRLPNDEDSEIVVPLNTSFRDYTARIADAVLELARRRDRLPEVVLREVLGEAPEAPICRTCRWFNVKAQEDGASETTWGMCLSKNATDQTRVSGELAIREVLKGLRSESQIAEVIGWLDIRIRADYGCIHHEVFPPEGDQGDA